MWLEYSVIAVVVALVLKFGRRWMQMARNAQSSREKRALVQNMDWEREGHTPRVAKPENVSAKLFR